MQVENYAHIAVIRECVRMIESIKVVVAAISLSASMASQTVSLPQITDLDLVARVVMSEAGGLDYTAKLGVAACIMNRVESPDYPNTIYEVVYQPNQFWTGNNGKPTEECYQAAREIMETNPFPEDLFWFRINYPHSFGYEYMHIGNTYFNTKTDYDTLILEESTNEMQ